jgi:Rrf2 family nitric oxide-sensitive transcriptional repressor
MRVTLHTDYSLRVLMYVATKGDGLSTIGEIAQGFEISGNHLMKVVHHLGKSGYLETVRGKNGGFRLAKGASQINIGAVVRDTEDDIAVIGCLQEPGYCCIEKVCVLRKVFRDATKAFVAVLDSYTLEDLIKPRATLARLLEIDFAPAEKHTAPVQ